MKKIHTFKIQLRVTRASLCLLSAEWFGNGRHGETNGWVRQDTDKTGQVRLGVVRAAARKQRVNNTVRPVFGRSPHRQKPLLLCYCKFIQIGTYCAGVWRHSETLQETSATTKLQIPSAITMGHAAALAPSRPKTGKAQESWEGVSV